MHWFSHNWKTFRNWMNQLDLIFIPPTQTCTDWKTYLHKLKMKYDEAFNMSWTGFNDKKIVWFAPFWGFQEFSILGIANLIKEDKRHIKVNYHVLKNFKTFISSNIPFSELHAGYSQSFKAKKCCNYSSSLVHLSSWESLVMIFKKCIF